MKIFGLSCFNHDAAACLTENGRVLAAAREEYFTRQNHDPAFPKKAAAFCLAQAAVTIQNIGAVVFYEKPFLKFDRLLQTYIATYPFGFSSFLKTIPTWLRSKMWMSSLIRKELNYRGEVYFTEHHLSQAASAFYSSGFEDAAILIADSAGEWAGASISLGRGQKIEILEEIHFPHSLGLVYRAFAAYLGLKENFDKGKISELAASGEPRFKKTILEHLVNLKEDGSFKLNTRFFSVPSEKIFEKKFEKLFGVPARRTESTLEKIHFDLAASLQEVNEEIMLRMARHAQAVTKNSRLCLAGDARFSNQRILKEGPFKEVFVSPFIGHAGAAYGAAAVLSHAILNEPRPAALEHTFWGPETSHEQVRTDLKRIGAIYKEYSEEDLLGEVASQLAEGKGVGWMQGRMEFAAAGFGHRVILANSQTAFADDFGPFTLVREENHGLPPKSGPLFCAPFTGAGEPLVCTPEEAWKSFMRKPLDILVIGNFFLDKTEQVSFKNESDIWELNHAHA